MGSHSRCVSAQHLWLCQQALPTLQKPCLGHSIRMVHGFIAHTPLIQGFLEWASAAQLLSTCVAGLARLRRVGPCSYVLLRTHPLQTAGEPPPARWSKSSLHLNPWKHLFSKKLFVLQKGLSWDVGISGSVRGAGAWNHIASLCPSAASVTVSPGVWSCCLWCLDLWLLKIN